MHQAGYLMIKRLTRLLGLATIALALLLVACGGSASDEEQVNALVRRSIDSVNRQGADRLWNTLCPSLQAQIDKATYEAGIRSLFAAGNVKASNLSIDTLKLDGAAGEVQYSFDLVAPGINATRRTESYSVRKESRGWCFEDLLDRVNSLSPASVFRKLLA